MIDYKGVYFGRVFIGFSQMLNAICGNNPDITMSAQIGKQKRSNLYWVIVESIVDFTFYPIDGKGHCYQSYLNDENEDYNVTINPTIGMFIMTSFLCLTCPFIGLFTWIYYLIKK